MSNAQQIIDFIHFSEGLKKELRTFTLSDGQRKESTAEHSWRLALLVMLVGPELNLEVNIDRAIKIAIAHDLVEIEAGDVSYMQHFGNQELKDSKDKLERAAMEKIKARFGNSGTLIESLWLEFEEQATAEAKLVKALDKIEARLQYLLDPIISFTEQETEKIPAVIQKTTELCSIDPFLAELEKLTQRTRKMKTKLARDSHKPKN
jgi:putative hydrolases of HD superfamily